jgi:helix-turn-helix protein
MRLTAESAVPTAIVALKIETTTHCCCQAMTVQELRSKRVAAEIPATLLAARAKVNRSRLSNLERGYLQPTEGELQRLSATLDQLIQAKSVIDRVAASVGWPTGARHDK